MAINKIITLTEEGLNAGPYYDVYYSSDCTNYTLATSSMYLPEVGSTGSVSIADNTICIKLVNLSPNCGLNEIVYDFRATTTTTVPPPPPFTTTTTTQAPGPTTTTTQGPLPTTTTYGPAVKVVAHSCQNFYDFNTYRVPSSPTPQIGGVYTDAYGTCYYITSIPTDQTLPGVGDLTYIGAEGACSSSSCVTTTTTAAPYCNQWTVSNNTGAGYTFKYYYCGQTQATYTEVPAGQSVTVCVQNDRIYNSFNAPLTFTNLNTSCIGTTTTTTLPPDLWKVVAHACQDFYDFNTYGVNKNLTPTININDVLKDDYGTCYYITSIPSDQTLPVVGILSYVGGSGACSSSACVTTTTTQAPFCNTWKVENTAGFGQSFKYKYCGQTTFLYPEVAANSSVTVCVQNNEIFDSFNTTLIFTNLSTVCNATTTTTTTQGPTVKFTAANCQNIYDFNVYQALSASYSLGDVFKDSFGTCYQILSFSGTTPVGTLTFLGTAGACSSPQCVTTTTTLSPFCNLWQVENPFGASYSFKYKYCGSTDFSYPTLAPYTSASFCVQNDQIYNAFGAPLVFTNLSGSCQATTTTTTTTAAPTTTTTTTRAPYCAIFNVVNNFGAGYNISYVYCGQTSAQFVEVPPYTTSSFCVQNAQISALGNPLVITETTSSCVSTTTTTTTTAAPTTTTTTTRAPYCSVWNAENPFGAGYTIQYTYCGDTGSRYTEIPAYTTRQLCVQSGKINNLGAPIVLTETTSSCTGGITTTTTAGPTTTTTTTAAPTTTTTTTISNQKVIIESCEGPGDITTPIQLAVNGPRLTNGTVVKLVGGFAGLDCYTIANSNWTGSVIYYADVEARFADCASCQAGTTTTTQPPTTTTAAPASSYWRAEWCCDPLKSSIIKNDTGLNFQNMVVWNPEINQCMRALETVTTQSVSYTYNSSNYNTYAFGYDANLCTACISSSLSDGCPAYGIFASCCDTGSTYIVYSTFTEIFTGSFVIYNPIANTCMQYVSSTTASTPDLTITSSSDLSTYGFYGNYAWSNTNCMASYPCPGVEYGCWSTASVYAIESSAEKNMDISWTDCAGTGKRVSYAGDGNFLINDCVKSGSISFSTILADFVTDFAIGYGTASCTLTTTTTTKSPLCQRYTIVYNTISCGLVGSATARWTDCYGNPQTAYVDRYTSVEVCAIQGTAGAGGCTLASIVSPNTCSNTTTTTSTTSTTTTTTAAPTTTTTSTTTTTTTMSPVWRAIGCCDSASYYVAWTAGGSYPYLPYTASAATLYNPNVNQCMTIVENVASQSVTFTINNDNYPTYVYGYPSGGDQCQRCINVNPCNATTTTSTTTSTTTTAAPTGYVSGAAVIYDFGNTNSYSGTGTLVYDISGNGVTGSLVGGPTYSAVSGGIMNFTKSSTQYMTYDGLFTSASTVMIIVASKDTNWAEDTGLPAQRSNNGLILTPNGSGNKQIVPILWYGSSGTTAATLTCTLTPTSITQFHMYTFTTNGLNSHKMWLDAGTTNSTDTSTRDRTLYTPTNQTVYIGRDPAVSSRNLNGYIMGYLVYNRVLTASEIQQNWNVFASRL